ncbi:hypothetical protein MTR_3g077400 [Medicago truncatula]|uniref:Uncharacterized protein n=1 Tax=Medicago truncatula TaxID=3880 RepID=G7J4V9_MEDTR|nr:hypothetical protein MTR_3g077400 [Medicago truncatula]
MANLAELSPISEISTEKTFWNLKRTSAMLQIYRARSTSKCIFVSNKRVKVSLKVLNIIVIFMIP